MLTDPSGRLLGEEIILAAAIEGLAAVSIPLAVGCGVAVLVYVAYEVGVIYVTAQENIVEAESERQRQGGN